MKPIILADSSLPLLETSLFNGFQLILYHNYEEFLNFLPMVDILLCRTNIVINQEIIDLAKNLKFIGTASSGVDHINKSLLKFNKIKLFDAKGCNAHAVTDYVISCLASIYTNITKDIKKVGIIGFGCVGNLLKKRLEFLNFEIFIYDPILGYTNKQVLANCDVVCVHADLHNLQPYPSFKLLDQKFFEFLSKKTIIIQAARGELTDEESLLEVFTINKNFIYCTDVYCNEPNINWQIVKNSYISTPHIAGHTLEAKRGGVCKILTKIKQQYNLPVNNHELFIKNNNYFINKKNWHHNILEYYNPLHENFIMKQATKEELTDTFLKLRKMHNSRHDIVIYD